MGIGMIYKELTFDGEHSGDFDLYITGEGVFNAPERDVEMIAIPGRNGAYALDHGRFENIEVVYPAGIFGVDEADFADKVAEIRAWFCSKKGYVYLMDDYHPDEYRLAVYKSGLEVSPALLKAGEFSLVFDCMPQRFLNSGDNKIAVASGGSITNPTRFPSKPMLEVKGYGNMVVNGYPVSLVNETLGRVQLTERGGANPSYSSPAYLSSLVNSGDALTILEGSEIDLVLTFNSGLSSIDIDLVNGGTFAHLSKIVNTKNATLRFTIDELNYTAGTSSTKTDAFNFEFVYRIGGGAEQHEYLTLTPTIAYNASTRKFTISLANTTWPSCILNKSKICFLNPVVADSSVSALGNPTYIDCEIGEAYKIASGHMVSLNNVANLGAELPQLDPGSNAVSFDNTITELKVVPRWWTV